MGEPVAIGWAVFLEPSQPALVIATALAALGVARLAAPAPSRRERVLGAAIWAATWIVASAQVLSLFRALHWPAMLALSAGCALIGRWPPGGVPVPKELVASPMPKSDVRWLVAFAVPALLYGLWSARLVVMGAEPLGDNTNYHIPRLAYWIQHQTVAPFPSNDPRVSTFPLVGNVLQLWPALFLKREQLGGLVQLSAHLGAALCVYGIARDLGSARPASAAAAFCWLAVPAALRQATTSNVDVVAAFFAAATAALAVGCLRRGGAWLAWTCFASACLAVGAKPQTLPFAAPCAAVALFALWRVRRARSVRALPGLLVLAALLAGLHLVRNRLAFGSASGLASVEWVVVNPGLPTFSKNVQLVLLPLTGGRGLDGAFAAWSFPDGLMENGLGVPWLVLVTCALVLAVTRGVRAPASRRLQSAYAGTALAYACSVLFMMRHQPSVDRFLLPAVAVLTPLVATLFVGRARPVWLACVWLLAAPVLHHWGALDHALRWTAGPPARFWSPTEAQGLADLGTLGRAADRLAAQGRGRRIGLITPQGAFQRQLLGPRFENAPVPLSHDPPLDLAAADRLGLDALMISAYGNFRFQLFRPRFVPPAGTAADGWRLTARDSFDADFIRAYERAVEYPPFEQTARLLGRAGSGWKVDRSVVSDVLLFVRGRQERAALTLVHVGGMHGVRGAVGQPWSWLGTRATHLTVFAGDSGTAVLQGRIRRGPHLRGDRAPVEIVDARGGRVETTAVIGTRWEALVPVRGGLNSFALRVPGELTTADRVNQLGLVNVRVRWAAEGTADDGP